MPGLTWNQENEATFLRTAHDQGWTPDLVQNLMSDYLRVAAGTMGTITDDMVTEFHQKYGDRLTQKERDALVQWIRRPA